MSELKAERKSGSIKQWLNDRPIILFVGKFAGAIILFYLATLIPFFQSSIFPAFLSFNAAISGFVLNLFGADAAINGPDISSSFFSLSVATGCDALEPMALFVAVVTAFPGSAKKKLIGIATGVLALFLVNQIRIISLYIIGGLWPEAFHIMHVDVWQVLFIAIALFFWWLWIRWSDQQKTA